MAEQRQLFRFRLPWLSATPAPRPAEPPRPTPEVKPPPQPTTNVPIQRPRFRPVGIATAQQPPQAQPPPSPPRAESRVVSQPGSPSRPTTQTRASSVPPSPSRSGTRVASQPTSPSPPATTRSRVASQPTSPSRATQTRASSVPPSPTRGATGTRVTSQSQTASPSRAATQPKAASVPPSPSHTAAQAQPATRAESQPQSPSRLASRPTSQTSSQPSSPLRKTTQPLPIARAVPQPPSPPKKLQPPAPQTAPPPRNLLQPRTSIPQIQEPKSAGSLQLLQEAKPKTQIKSETVPESQNQTASEITFNPPREAAQPAQTSGLASSVAPTPVAAPEPPSAAPKKMESNPNEANHSMSFPESEKKSKERERKKAAEELTKQEKSEGAKESAAEKLVKEEKIKGSTDDEQLHRTLTKLLAKASGSETKTKELRSATYQTGERKQDTQEIFEKKPLTTSKPSEKQIRTVSPTHGLTKDRNNLGNTHHQRPVISNGERPPLHKEIKEDISKFVHKLAIGHPKQPMDDKPVSIITLAGENKGASMQLGSESAKKDGSVHIHRGYKINSNETLESTTDGEGSSKGRGPKDPTIKEDRATKAYINNNVQSINNSIMFNSSVNERNPGVHLVFSHNLAEPTKSTVKQEPLETRKAEFGITPSEKLTYEPTVRRRCLRGLFMEPSDSDPDNPEKPRRHGCLYNCGEKSKDKEIGVL